MCKMPDPEEFSTMQTQARDEVFYSVLSKLASRARFTNWILPVAFTTLLAPAVTWVWQDGQAQDKRTERLEDRVDRLAVQDSMATQAILRGLDEVQQELKELHPRRSARR